MRTRSPERRRSQRRASKSWAEPAASWCGCDASTPNSEDPLQGLASTAGDEQDEVLTRLWRLAFSHAYAEETVVWPAVRGVSDDGDELTLHIEQGHQKLSELTAELDRTRPGDPAREDLLAEPTAELRLDIREEEDVLLPRLRNGADDRRLRRPGLAWTVVRHAAPAPRPPAVHWPRRPGRSSGWGSSSAVSVPAPAPAGGRCTDG